MTETERWVNGACEYIVIGGHIMMYHDLYRDLRERLPCTTACRLIAVGLGLSRATTTVPWIEHGRPVLLARARAIAALRRLERYASRLEAIAMLERCYGT